jgi:hypothetical protein
MFEKSNVVMENWRLVGRDRGWRCFHYKSMLEGAFGVVKWCTPIVVLAHEPIQIVKLHRRYFSTHALPIHH